MQETPFKRHEPLYLKYRPQSLAELVGQEGVNRTLVNAIENNRLSHAYLFTGPRGTGKTSSARILAKSLNCKSAGRPTIEPCQTCSCCLEITHGNSPAVFEIDAASNNSVDDARVLIERAPLVAVGGDYKVYIIDECHMLTKEAFNALLKTIEQPPPNVVFILATTEEHKVLPTIISRCQRLMFKLINQDELTKHLRYVADSEGIEIEEEALQLIARRSGGGLRDALSNLDQASLLAAPGSPATVSDLLRLLGALHEDVLLDLSRQIAERDGQAVITSVNQFLAEGREPQVVLQELARHFLSLIKASYLTGARADVSSLSSLVLGSESYINGLLAQAGLFDRAELSQIIEQLDRLEQTCRRSSQPAMHLEIGLLGICHRHDIYLLKDLLLRVQRLEENTGAAAHELPATQSRMQHAPLQRPPAAALPQAAHQAPSTFKQSLQSEDSAPPGQSGFSSTASPPPAQSGFSSTAGSEAEITSIALAPAAHEPASRLNGQIQTAGASESLIERTHSSADETAQSADSLPTKIGERQAQTSTIVETRQAAVKPVAVTSASNREASLDEESSDDPRINELNSDIEYFWQQVLDELQRRHLPTFSLASTHAFPVRIGAREVAIGVMKENFQKMLESKSEHLRVACQAVTGLDLAIRIRVAEANTPAAKKPVTASRPVQASIERNEAPEARSAPSSAPALKASARAEEEPEPTFPESEPQLASSSSQSKDEFDSTMVKEAYKLFEGPGSRQIN